MTSRTFSDELEYMVRNIPMKYLILACMTYYGNFHASEAVGHAPIRHVRIVQPETIVDTNATTVFPYTSNVNRLATVEFNRQFNARKMYSAQRIGEFIDTAENDWYMTDQMTVEPYLSMDNANVAKALVPDEIRTKYEDWSGLVQAYKRAKYLSLHNVNTEEKAVGRRIVPAVMPYSLHNKALHGR